MGLQRYILTITAIVENKYGIRMSLRSQESSVPGVVGSLLSFYVSKLEAWQYRSVFQPQNHFSIKPLFHRPVLRRPATIHLENWRAMPCGTAHKWPRGLLVRRGHSKLTQNSF
jgi:hypothetical protein